MKGCNQSGMPCVGSSLSVSSKKKLCWFTVSRMLACHFESSLDLMMFPIHRKNLTDPLVSMWKPSCCCKMMTILVRQEARSCPSYKYLSSHFWVNHGVSPFFHSYEYPCSEQSIPSDRTAGVSSSNCTVTNRSRS